MKQILIILIGLLFFGCNQKKNTSIYYGKTIKLEPTEEPPMIFELTIDGSTNYLLEKEIKTFKGDFSSPEVQIKVHNWRQFPHGNLSFEYPSNYTFESEIDKSSQIWTLSGNDFKIMYMKLLTESSAKKYADNLCKKHGSSNCTRSPISKNFNGVELKGTKLIINLMHNVFTYEIYDINTNDAYSSFFVFIDFIKEDGKNSDESKMALDRISKTLRIKK